MSEKPVKKTAKKAVKKTTRIAKKAPKVPLRIADRRKLKEIDLLKQSERKVLYSTVFGTEQGQLVLQDICNLAGMFTCFKDDVSLEGQEYQRRLAFEVLKLSNTRPDSIMEQFNEQLKIIRG